MRFRKLALAVVTCLVAMVTMGTSVSAASLSELQAQESSTQKSIDDTKFEDSSHFNERECEVSRN